MISNQKAQSCGRMVLAVPALMLSEFVLLSQEVIKLSQSNLRSHFREDRKQRDRRGPDDHRLLGGVQSQTFSKP